MERNYKVHVMDRLGKSWFSEHKTYEKAKFAFTNLSRLHGWVLINMYHGGKFLKSLDASEEVMVGKPEEKKKGTNYDHTGFCMSTFNTVACYDCPTLKECIVLMMKDNTIAILEQIKEDTKHGN